MKIFGLDVFADIAGIKKYQLYGAYAKWSNLGMLRNEVMISP